MEEINEEEICDECCETNPERALNGECPCWRIDYTDLRRT